MMHIELEGETVQLATGGVDSAEGEPVLLIHGAGMDRTVWQLQTRFLAHHGYRPMAVDMPGRGGSGGTLLESVADMTRWVGALVDELAMGPVHIVGHSMGALVALEFAAARLEIVRTLTLLGTAQTMPVHPELISAAVRGDLLAAELMTAWGHGTNAHVASNPTPGMWMVGGGQALLERAPAGVIANDLKACNGYVAPDGLAAMIGCPVTIVVGSDDRMTPPRAAGAVVEALRDAGVALQVVELTGIGHAMMSEDPAAVRKALIASLTSP